MYCFVNKEKCCQISTFSVWFYFNLLVFAHLCNKIEKCQLQKSLKYFSILRPMKTNVKFEYIPWKYIWFCFISILWVHFSHKTKKFRFWRSLKYFKVFDKKMMSDLIMSCQITFGLSFVVWMKFWQEVEKYEF